MTATDAATSTPLLAAPYRWATIGMVSLIFLAAFENLAVTTVMPTVAADLHGRSWFSAAFAATLAASVVGTVAGGRWCDRTGPRSPLLASVAVFVGGLLLAGLAPGIEVFVAARFLQGLGSGGLTVALYVLVARLYAPADHPAIFGAFAAAWVVPSMVGPSVAGAVAQSLGWRWVFLGVVALALVATSAVLPAVRALTAEPVRETTTGRRPLVLAVVVAAGVVGLDLAGRSGGPVGYVAAAAALVVVVVAVRGLLPAGTLVARRGLPAVVALRGVVAAAFFASEIYLPYLLQTHYDVPPWLSGATLTVGACGWAAGSQVQARLGARISHQGPLRAGSVLLAVGIGGELAATSLHLTAWLVGAAWVLAGAGMGLVYPRVSALVLAASTAADQGANSAAMAIADNVGGASAISLTGLLFVSAGDPTQRLAPFVAALSLTTVIAVVSLAVARRT